MTRSSGLAISLLAGGAVAVGAYTGLTRAQLGLRPPERATVAHTVVASRSARLNRYAAALDRTLAQKPPRLPRVPHFKPVVIPQVPKLVVPPAPKPVPAKTPAPAGHAVLVDAPVQRTPVAKHTAAKPATAAQPAPVPAPTSTTPADRGWSSDDSPNTFSSDDGLPGGGGTSDDGWSNDPTGSPSHDD